MANHVSHGSLPFPVKGARFTILVPYLDADGDPTDPTTPDTEVSQDGGAFADAAEEVTTITGSNGLGYITLSGAEMNNSLVGVAFKVASGPKATLMTLQPRVLPIILTGTASAGAAGSITLAAGAYPLEGCIVKTTGGTGGGGTGGANNQARIITAYNTSTLVATVSPNWETTPDNTTTYDVLLTDLAANAVKANVTHYGGAAGTFSGGRPEVNTTHAAGTAWGSGAITAASIASDAITDAKVASDVTIASVTGSVGSVTGNVGGNVTGSVGSIATGGIAAASFAAGAIDAAAIAANAIGASELAADAVTEIQAGLATAADLATVAGYIDTEVAAIKAKTDQLTFGTANRVDAQVYGMEANTVTASAIAADAGAEIADAFLNRDMSTGTDSGSATVRTPRQALRFLRNKWDVSGGTLTVKKEDDSTTSWTAAVSTDAAADPIIGSDPASA